jgi:hypothetical protein
MKIIPEPVIVERAESQQQVGDKKDLLPYRKRVLEGGGD